MGWLCNEEDVSTEIDLNGASRETLLEIIETQQKVIAELRNRVEYLERIISSGGSAGGMPGNKPNSRRRGSDRPESRKSPKQRPHGFARRRMEPTRRVTHAAESCFECGTALAGGWVHRRREVVEVPLAPAEVVEHVFVARMCALCRKRRLPDEPLRGQAVGRRRFGVNLLSLIVTLREEGRLPIRAIQQYLQTVHQLKLSAGAIVEVIHGVARQAQSSVAETLERVRASAVVHADETGWRQDGVNGYVWTFSTPTERYFVRGGRNKEVVDEVLGDCFSGVLVSDFYAAYNHYPGLKQRCWAHLLRDVDDLQASYPKTPCWPDGPLRCIGSTERRRQPPTQRQRQNPGFGYLRCNWSWKSGCWRFAVRTTMTRRRHRPDSAGAYGSSSKSCSYSYPTRKYLPTTIRRNGA